MGWLVGAVGIETIILLETKEFCGATWPSKSLNGKEGNPYCPLIAPEKLERNSGYSVFSSRIRTWRSQMQQSIRLTALRIKKSKCRILHSTWNKMLATRCGHPAPARESTCFASTTPDSNHSIPCFGLQLFQQRGESAFRSKLSPGP